jgi:uncharacterized membrane protein YvlD (DUF360 family)
MVKENRAEGSDVPLAIQLVAGFAGSAMLFFMLVGLGVVLGLAVLQFTGNPALLVLGRDLLILILAWLGPPLDASFPHISVLGFLYLIIGLWGILMTIGAVARKPRAVSLGVGVCIVCIVWSVASYVVATLDSLTFLGLFSIPLRAGFSGLALAVFLVGALLLWQFGRLSGARSSPGRFVLIWNLDAICLVWMVWLTPGVEVSAPDFGVVFGMAYAIVAVVSAPNLLVRPLLTRLIVQTARWARGFALAFLLTLLLNAGVLSLLPLVIPGFAVFGFPVAFLGSLMLSAINTVFIGIVGLEDDTSFFQNRVRHQLRARAAKAGVAQTRGLVCIQIDGLSHVDLRDALRRGYAPTLRSLLQSKTFKLTQWDCGLPSTTSSTLAGIMHGNNHDIPGFTWYRKAENRILVFNHPKDAEYIEETHSSGNGLLRGGASIGNVFGGDAAYAFFTLSTLANQTRASSKRRCDDLYYYLLNPYGFTRTVVCTLWDMLIGFAQVIRWRVTPKKSRTTSRERYYPFYRAATNVLLRDIVTSMVILSLLRGSPVVYATYFGYDEIAHHSGLHSIDALKALQGIDYQILRILRVINRYASRPYQLIVLSDHGQSPGRTFTQRYGHSLKEEVAGSLKEATHVSEVEVGHTDSSYISSIIADFKNGPQNARQRIPRGYVRPSAGEPPEKQNASSSTVTDDVIVCASGNIAHIYFAGKQDHVTLEDFEVRYPGFLANLVAHEGIGFIVVMDAADGPLLLGKEGAIALRTGHVKGTNPLCSYGREDVRVRQLLRLAEFPSSGDLILNSPIYPDGSIAAYEELVSSHGGLGGPQTEPFLLHPANMDVDGTRLINSDQIYTLFTKHRTS